MPDTERQTEYCDIDIEAAQTVMFDTAELPLDDNEWQQLAQILAESEYQHVIGGDANEAHSVWVSRYYNDVESPTALADNSEAIRAIVMSDKMRRFYSRFTGTDDLCLRRCQANRLCEGDYIGEHCDKDSSPDYFATVVFHFDSAYEGGFFETLEDGSSQLHVKPRAHTALVNNCQVPHRVTPVTSGQRVTLACFLSKSFAPNVTNPVRFRTDSTRHFSHERDPKT